MAFNFLQEVGLFFVLFSYSHFTMYSLGSTISTVPDRKETSKQTLPCVVTRQRRCFHVRFMKPSKSKAHRELQKRLAYSMAKSSTSLGFTTKYYDILIKISYKTEKNIQIFFIKGDIKDKNTNVSQVHSVFSSPTNKE